MIESMSPFELVISFALVLLTMTAVMAVMFYMLQKNRESRYNIEKHRVELDMLRHNIESQIYGLNERLTKTGERFKDAYHLQLEGNSKTEISPNNKIQPNEFLLSAGLSHDDLREQDFVFVITPFHEEFNSVYKTIKTVCDQADIRCVRGDEQNFKGDIFSHVLKNIVQAKFIIANLSGRNPNVMYELGIAHALDKTTILVSELIDELPVDIKSKRIVTYKSRSELEGKLAVELLKAANRKPRARA